MAQLCTPQYATTALNCSLASVYRLIERGELGAIKIGSDYRIPIAEIDRFIERGLEAQKQRVALKYAPRRGRRPATAPA